MTRTTRGYRLALPRPWTRLRVADRQREVARVVEGALAQVPSSVPPDQLAPYRRDLTRQLDAALERAAAEGVLDYYLPVELMHGVALNAGFTVASTVPDTTASVEDVPDVMAHLLRDEDTHPVVVADTTWLRRQEVRPSHQQDLPEEVVVRYSTAVPGDEQTWVLVTFTTIGDGDPRSEHTALVVDLFDAMMSTWRWTAPVGSA